MKFAWPTASLRTYLVAMILLASVPTAALMAWQLVSDAHARQLRLEDSLESAATTVASGVAGELMSSAEALQLLLPAAGLTPAQAPGHLSWMREQQRLRPSWLAVFLVDRDGRVLAATSEVPAPPAAPASAAIAVSSLVTWPDGRHVTALSVPAAGGRFRLGVWMDAQRWQRLLESVQRPHGGFATLYDDQQRVIARTLSPGRFVGRSLPPDVAAVVRERPAGSVRGELLEGGASYTAWHDVAHSGWGVGVGVAADAVDSAERRAMLLALGAAGGCLLLGVTMALWMARRITGPLRALGIDTPAGHGPTPVREIAELRDALVGARIREAAARIRLQRKADEFEAVFVGSPVGLALAQDRQARQVMMNPALQALMRRADGSGPAPTLRIDGEPVAPADAPLRRAAATGQPVGPTGVTLDFGGSEPAREVVVQAVPLVAGGRSRGALAVVVDVTEQQRAQQERVALIEREQCARREAEEASQAKDEFLAMLGHELRNPLNAIASAAEVLNLIGGASAEAADAQRVIARQTRHLARMLDDLLHLASVVGGRIVLERRPLALGRLVAGVVANVRLTGEARAHRLEVQTEDVWVDGDEARLEQVVNNLLNNALRHTPPGGCVTVTVHADGDQALLVVSDTGPGIPAALLPRVFDLFVQGRRSLDRRGGGLGVGLSVVRRLVQLHGGSVDADSSADGSRFCVRLPRIASAEPPPRPPEVRAARPRSVLLVEDNEDALHTLQAVLRLDGHAVSTASNGETGLAALLRDRPEVGVIDIGLPVLDGFEFARRSRDAGYAGRLIALSGYGQEHDVQQALQAGFDVHLAKPVDFERLRALLADA